MEIVKDVVGMYPWMPFYRVLIWELDDLVVRLILFVPFAASVHGHNTQSRQQNLNLHLPERLVSEAAGARRDAGPPSASRPPRAPQVDHDDGPVSRPSAGRPAICYCAQRPRALVYVAS